MHGIIGSLVLLGGHAKCKVVVVHPSRGWSPGKGSARGAPWEPSTSIYTLSRHSTSSHETDELIQRWGEREAFLSFNLGTLKRVRLSSEMVLERGRRPEQAAMGAGRSGRGSMRKDEQEETARGMEEVGGGRVRPQCSGPSLSRSLTLPSLTCHPALLGSISLGSLLGDEFSYTPRFKSPPP